MAKLKPGHYVVIYETTDKGDREEKRLGPYETERLAEKADSGANRNLNHERFWTRIEHVG